MYKLGGGRPWRGIKKKSAVSKNKGKHARRQESRTEAVDLGGEGSEKFLGGKDGEGFAWQGKRKVRMAGVVKLEGFRDRGLSRPT